MQFSFFLFMTFLKFFQAPLAVLALTALSLCKPNSAHAMNFNINLEHVDPANVAQVVLANVNDQ